MVLQSFDDSEMRKSNHDPFSSKLSRFHKLNPVSELDEKTLEKHLDAVKPELYRTRTMKTKKKKVKVSKEDYYS